MKKLDKSKLCSSTLVIFHDLSSVHSGAKVIFHSDDTVG
jgi:hypothetical protein